MTVATPLESALDRRPRLGLEVLIVLGVSLGQSAVYSVLRIIERLTRPEPLAQQTSTLNASATPDRPWLDLTYQLVGIGFGMMPGGAPEFYAGLPSSVEVVLGSGIAAGGICAIALNLLLNHRQTTEHRCPAPVGEPCTCP